MQRTLTLVLTVAVAGLIAAPALAHEDEDEPPGDSGGAYVLQGELLPEGAVPGPGPESAHAFPQLTVVPGEGSLCYEIGWAQMDPITGFVIRLGYPEDFEAINIDFGSSPPDEVEAFDVEGTVYGCAEAEPDLLDFLAHEAEFSHMTVHTAGYPEGAAGGELWLVEEPGFDEDTQDEGPVEAETFVLVAELSHNQVVPRPDDLEGYGFARLDVTPEFSEVCWEVDWEDPEPVTGVHLHIGSDGDVDPRQDFDLYKEAQTFGGVAQPGYTQGCVAVFDLMDFWLLADAPESHYIDIHTDAHPDGVLRGQLTLEEIYVSSSDEGHVHGDSRRSFADYLPAIVGLVVLLTVTIFIVVTLVRSRGLFSDPPAGAAAAIASAFTVLALGVVLIGVDLLEGEEGIVGCAQDAYYLVGLVLALAGVGLAVAGAVGAGPHPPLRATGIMVAVGTVAVAIGWFLWVPLHGCLDFAGNDDIDEHATTTTIVDGHADFMPGALDCGDTIVIHGDPEPSFQGFATPEEAVAGSMLGQLAGEPIGDDQWLLYLGERPVALATISSWSGSRFVVFDLEVCEDVAEMADGGEL